MKNKIWLLTIALFMGACGTSGTLETEPADTSSVAEPAVTEQSEETVSVSLDIVVEGEELAELSREVEAAEGMTLMEVMTETYEVEEEAGFIQSIEGYEQSQEDNRWWLYEINGEDGEVGAAEYEVEDGDQIVWTLTAF